jgi:hypothetical protein
MGSLHLAPASLHDPTRKQRSPQKRRSLRTCSDRPFLEDCGCRNGHRRFAIDPEGMPEASLLENRVVRIDWFLRGHRPHQNHYNQRSVESQALRCKSVFRRVDVYLSSVRRPTNMRRLLCVVQSGRGGCEALRVTEKHAKIGDHSCGIVKHNALKERRILLLLSAAAFNSKCCRQAQ